ncbi:hypothetical protein RCGINGERSNAP_89 [Rhodobacter phage RcGingersnap]|nr:hypothetical protein RCGINGERSNAP_89 [Rhodobacter phage RcGingersnap]UUV43459.1 hypothetical protein RCEXPLORER_90 [Rhodobacter phage RcExplorer]
MAQARLIWASGTKGNSIRADGNGGTMARGWYVIYGDGSKAGPFAGKRAAVDRLPPSDAVDYRMGILPRSDYSKGN